jgi:hypothetical protein
MISKMVGDSTTQLIFIKVYKKKTLFMRQKTLFGDVYIKYILLLKQNTTFC